MYLIFCLFMYFLPQVMELFTVVDSNSDGNITPAEFKTALTLAGSGWDFDTQPENAAGLQLFSKIAPKPISDDDNNSEPGPLKMAHKVYMNMYINYHVRGGS